MKRRKDIAKFFCGMEVYHAFVHAYFWFSGAAKTEFGITQTPALNMTGVIVNVLVSVVLGLYAWRHPSHSDKTLVSANDKITNT